MSYAYSGLGQQASAVSEPPKDPPSHTVTPVPMTPGLYTTSSTQTALPTSVQTALPWLTPTTSASQQALPDWRRQIQRALEAAVLALLALPGDVIARLIAFFAGIAPAVRQEAEDFGRSLTTPSVSDRDVAEKLRKVTDRYRSLRPVLPAPAVGVLDPIIANVESLVPPSVVVPSVQTPSFTVPWLWVTGSFVAGMVACSFFGNEKKVNSNRRRRARRNRRRR